MKRSPLRRKKPLRARKPMKKVNRARKAKRFERDYAGPKADWIRSRGCVVPIDKGHGGKIEASHVKSRGAGGGAEHLVPMCSRHHREFHDLGRKTFSDKYGLMLYVIAKVLDDYWRDHSYQWRSR